MFLNKIKQNLAGFAVVVVAFAGLTAMSPATASVSAVADTTNTKFRVYKAMTASGNVATASVGDAANLGRGYIAVNWTINQATADSLIGHSLSATVTVTGPNGSYDLSANGFFEQFIIYHNSTAVVQQGQPSSNPSAVWPTGTNSTNTSVMAGFYTNNATFSFPTGNYSVTAVLKDNGSAVTLGSGITFSGGNFEYAVPGKTLTSLETGTSWDSGFVCVDMTQVAANDVLTIEKSENGTATSGLFSDWYNNGSTSMPTASGSTRTVTSADITNGALAMRATSVGISTALGQALTMGINIKKANGTDVSTSCGPSVAPAAPTASAMGSMISVTPAASLPAGYAMSCALVDSSNTIVATGSASSGTCSIMATASGTFTAKLAYTRYGVPGTYSASSSSFTYTYTPPAGPCNVAFTSLTPTVAQLTTTSPGYTLYANGNTSITNCYSNALLNSASRVTLNGVQVSASSSVSASLSVLASAVPRTLAMIMANAAVAAQNPQDGAVYTVSFYSGLSAVPTANDTPVFSYSVTLYPSGATPGSNSNSNSNSNSVSVTPPTIPTNVPLITPISAPVSGVVAGGVLQLGGRNMATVTGVKIDATAATTVTTVAGIEVKVPADLAPGAHDLLITTATGSTLFVGAIKVADPVLVAAKAATAKAAASIAYRAPVDLTVGKAVTASQAAATKALAAQYRGAKNAVCVAIPASKATVASALAAAAKVCATIKSAIPGIKTVVVVGAVSGDATNRVSAEIQG